MSKTLLFIILLMMSNMMFSQKKPKIVWEEKGT